MWRIRIDKKFKRIFILGIIDTMYLISYELVYTIGITMLTPDRIDKQVNLAGIDQSWTNLLNHLDIDSHPEYNIDKTQPWYLANFVDYLRLLNFKFDELNLREIRAVDYDLVDWSFLKSNRLNGAEVFKDLTIYLQKPNFVTQYPKCVPINADVRDRKLAEVIYDYYRRFLPFFYSFIKLIRSTQRLSLERKLPVIDNFMSNFGDLSTGEFYSNIPFDDAELKRILKNGFEKYREHKSEQRFSRAIAELTPMFKALSEYLKIVSTVNYVDLDLIHFLHNAFLGKNFNVYSDLFAMDKEPNLLVNLSWTYTKAVVYVHRLY